MQLPLTDKIRNQYSYEKMIRKYLIENLNLTEKEINLYHVRYGDISKLVMENYNALVQNSKTSYETKLTIEEVYNYKERIFNISGINSSEYKLNEFKLLIKKTSSNIEALFITRTFLNKLGIGLSEKGIILSLLKLKDLENPNSSSNLEAKEKSKKKVKKSNNVKEKVSKEKKNSTKEKEIKRAADQALDLQGGLEARSVQLRTVGTNKDKNTDNSEIYNVDRIQICNYNSHYEKLIKFIETEILNYKISGNGEYKIVPGNN